MNKIVFTGGGTAGHVTPNLALIAVLRRKGWTIDYIGSAEGIEKAIVTEAGIPFHSVSSGKLRRYFDLKNFKDPFKVMKGVWDAYRVLRRLRPDVVFSKGGFVTVPVVLASRLLRIPVIIHESDLTPGLANRISIPFANRVCVTFPETAEHLPADKAVVTGLPIREELTEGKAQAGRNLCDFVSARPVLMIMGGSLGAKAINETVRENLTEILETFQIIHICGKGNVDDSLNQVRGYCQFEYVGGELPHLIAAADVIISRAGATSIFEFLAMKKPMVLIPLSRQASRGDQILNARSFEKKGFCRVLNEEELNGSILVETVLDVYRNRNEFAERFQAEGEQQALDLIVGMIERTRLDAKASTR